MWQSDAVSVGQRQPLDDRASLGMFNGEPHDYAIAEPGEQIVDKESGGDRIPHGD